MRETDQLSASLRDAVSFPAVLAAAWDAFEFLQQTAWEFAEPQPGTYGFPFLLATVAARHGRNALAAAPSLAADEGTDDHTSPICVLNREQAAAALAALAAQLEQRLTHACARSSDGDDRRACATGIAAAAETHALLAWAACTAMHRPGGNHHGERPAALLVLSRAPGA
jgi:hypothetical protein